MACFCSPTLGENARRTCRTAPAFFTDLRSRISPLRIWLAQRSRAGLWASGMDSRASANSVCIPLKFPLRGGEVIAGYGAQLARNFSGGGKGVSKAEKGPG